MKTSQTENGRNIKMTKRIGTYGTRVGMGRFREFSDDTFFLIRQECLDLKNIQHIELHKGSKEEIHTDFTADFPCISSRAELDKYIGRFVPWHWHRPVELFYMESGRTVRRNAPAPSYF